MINRKFTRRETILLLVLAVLLLAIFYYVVLWRPVTEGMSRDRALIAQVQDTMTSEQVKAQQKKQMLSELDKVKDEKLGSIEPYSNVKNEMNELYQALADADSYNLTFSDARAVNTIVRRDVTVSFQASSWETAYNILQKIQDSRYRCQLMDLSLSAQTKQGAVVTDPNAQAGQTTVTATAAVRFFETTVGATNTNGLIYEKQETKETGDTDNANAGKTGSKK